MNNYANGRKGKETLVRVRPLDPSRSSGSTEEVCLPPVVSLPSKIQIWLVTTTTNHDDDDDQLVGRLSTGHVKRVRVPC